MNSASLIESSDNAMQDHNAMVTMGFGNNDNATITRKLRQLFSFFYAERLFWVLVETLLATDTVVRFPNSMSVGEADLRSCTLTMMS